MSFALTIAHLPSLEKQLNIEWLKKFSNHKALEKQRRSHKKAWQQPTLALHNTALPLASKGLTSVFGMDTCVSHYFMITRQIVHQILFLMFNEYCKKNNNC